MFESKYQTPEFELISFLLMRRERRRHTSTRVNLNNDFFATNTLDDHFGRLIPFGLYKVNNQQTSKQI